MKYSSNVLKLAGAYYTDARGVTYSILRASGMNRAAAYFHAFHFTGSDDAKEDKAKQFEEKNEYITQLINDLKHAKRVPILPDDNTPTTTKKTPGIKENALNNNNVRTENEGGNVLQTLSDIRAALVDVAGDVDGKEKANVLIQLAKITPDDQKPEEKRVKMYLPFNADCKQCALFKAKMKEKRAK